MPMDFMAARDRVRKLIASRKPGELSKSALRPDPLRDNIIREQGTTTERFRAQLDRWPEVEYDVTNEDTGTTERKSFVWDTYGEALKDIARAGFDLGEAQMMPEQQVRASHQLNRALVQEYVRSEEFQASRPYTQGNAPEALFNALAAGNALEDLARERLAEHIARSNEMGEQEEAEQSAEQMMEDLRQQARADVANDGTVADTTRRGIKQAMKAIANAQQAIEDLLKQQAQSNFAVDVRAAAQEAAKAGEDMVRALNSLPGLEPGEAHNLSPDKQIELAEKWAQNPDMLRVLEMLGRMFPAFKMARQSRSTNVPIEPVGVTTGRHLERLLPSEVAMAHNPRTRPMFIKRYVDHSLLEYEMVGREPTNKGPVICVVDGSGSMQGESFIWATSVCLCLFKLARREKRAFAGVEFGSPGQLKSWVFPKREPADPDKVLDMASHFFGGGTSIFTGMEEAWRICAHEPEFDTADVVLVGDGADHYADRDEALRKRMTDAGVRIHGISILTPGNSYFEQMCEWATDVMDLAGANSATDTLAHRLT